MATEVRTLAHRSAEAAKEIKGLITAASSAVESGVGLVAQTGSDLQRIITQVSEIDTLVGTISASAQEQAAAFGGGQLRHQQHGPDGAAECGDAGGVGGGGAGAAGQGEATKLGDMVGRFKIARNGPAAAPARSMRRAS